MPVLIQTNNKGSIMIWTVLLGVLLTTVFFFTATRLQFNASVQRETIAIQNQRAYLESFVEYAKSKGPGVYNFEGMNITISDQVDTIEGFLDIGDIVQFTFIDDVTVCWNQGTENGDIIINDDPKGAGVPCSNSGSYSSTVAISDGVPLKLQTLQAPLHYYVESNPVGTQLIDVKKHLTATASLEYGKEIRIEEIFELETP